ncbi:MAG TPA: diguanylate cyclase [Herpetosiphonaceae bacterium]
MELRAYLHILWSKWWIVLLTLLITYSATLIFTYQQVPLYQSNATFVVKLSPTFSSDKDLAAAVDILSRRTEIGTTFTQVADSRLIKRLAATELGLSGEQRNDVSITSELLPGTNVLKIAIQSHDPVLARNMANAVGANTIAYVQDLYETYKLEPLDQASLPDEPISPNKPLNLALGGIMGLVLGAGFALLAAYLQAPAAQPAGINILDHETEVYTRRFLELRLRQEVSRARRLNSPLSLALLNVDRQRVLAGAPPQIQREALRRAALLIVTDLREEDVIARFGDTTFAVLLLDRTPEAAAETVRMLQTKLTSTPLDLAQRDLMLNLQVIVGYADFEPGSMEAEDLVVNASNALKAAETNASGMVYPALFQPAAYQLGMAKVTDHE